MDEHLLAALKDIYRMHLMEKGVVVYDARLSNPDSYHNCWGRARKHLDQLPDDIVRQLTERPKRKRIK